MTGVLKTREDTQWPLHKKKKAYEDIGRNGVLLPQTRECLGLSEATMGREGFFSNLWEHDPDDVLILDIYSPEL